MKFKQRAGRSAGRVPERRSLLRLLAAAASLGAHLGTVGAASAALAERSPTDGAATVFAAASLQNALKDMGEAYERRTGVKIAFSFAGSSALARQIEQGAPADVFISADVRWMDDLESKGLIQNGTRRALVSNRLALVAPKSSALALAAAPGFPLAAALGSGRLAMAAESVPAAVYGKAALTALGVWPSVEGRVVRAEDVRGALNFVARGEAPLGIVYDTDALVEPRVRVVALFPDDSHPPIVYPAALLKGARPEALGFLRFVEGPEGRRIFARYRFRPLP